MQKPNLENVAETEGRAVIFQCDAVPFLVPSMSPNTKPSSLLVVDLLWQISCVFETEEQNTWFDEHRAFSLLLSASQCEISCS